MQRINGRRAKDEKKRRVIDIRRKKDKKSKEE
jgi:hypothetical protein